MSKGFWRTILILLLIGFGLFLLWRLISPQLEGFNTPTSGSVNVDLADTLPDSWFVISGDWPDQCDFDRDGENEQLVVYRYDPPATPGPSSTAGLIGAVIFDSQVNRVPQEPSVESPSRPAFLIPYKLLPDIYADKGQGYLGEADIQVDPCTRQFGQRERLSRQGDCRHGDGQEQRQSRRAEFPFYLPVGWGESRI